jgi:hypothetical protein
MSPVKYELGFYIPEDDILHSDLRENLKAYKLKSFKKSAITCFGLVNHHHVSVVLSLKKSAALFAITVCILSVPCLCMPVKYRNISG